MVEVFTAGMMEASTMEIGLKTKSKVLELTHGWTAENIKENGLITTWTVLVFTPGKTAENMKESTKMTKNTDSESTSGQMAVSIGVIGQGGNNMDWAFTLFPTRVKSMAYGRKVNVLSGSTRNKSK